MKESLRRESAVIQRQLKALAVKVYNMDKSDE